MPACGVTSRHGRGLAWPGLYNARDLGGMPAAWGLTVAGRLIRADSPGVSLPPATVIAIRDYGIRGVVDLRSREEAKAEPSIFSAQPQYRLVPLLDEAARLRARQAENSQALLRHLLLHHSQGLAAALRSVHELSAHGGVLVHCRAGKDRTGIVVALILANAGVSDAAIAADYAASGAVTAEQADGWAREGRAPDAATLHGIRKFVPAERDMLGALGWLQAVCGSPNDYLRLAGLEEPVRLGLRRLLAPAAT